MNEESEEEANVLALHLLHSFAVCENHVSDYGCAWENALPLVVPIVFVSSNPASAHKSRHTQDAHEPAVDIGQTTMADIPLISITKEGSDEDELSTSSAVNKPNIEDALTDTEDLIMDPSYREKKGSPATPIPPYNSSSLLDALQPETNGAVTDVEDCSDTSDEEDGDKKSAREVEISLDDFLDQGYVDEMTKSNQGGTKPKILTRSCSKATTDSSSLGRTLQVIVDTGAALTDCEDCAMSEDEGEDENAIPDCPEDILMQGDEDNGTVDIHNAVRRRQEKHLPRAEPVQSSSSDSEEPECKVVRHRKPHRKGQAVPENRNTSDCENIVVSDDESGACARPRTESMFEADEITMEGSDRENEQSTVYPEINICFVTDRDGEEATGKAKVSSASRPSSLSVGQPNPDEAVTDVENLDSSDSDAEAPRQSKKLMPRAVARGGKGGAGLTDVEDFNASDDDNDEGNHLNLGGEDHSFLPSPTREISIMRGDGSGEQTANVMPLNQSCLLVRTPDIEQPLTDFEDLVVNDDEEKMYDDSKYTIEALPEMDNDNVYASENSAVAQKQHWVEKVHDPVTDTEDIYLDRGQEKSCPTTVTFGSNELRRRRKPKSSAAAAAGGGGGCPHSFKGKTFLETSAPDAPEESGAATTDVEDLYLSDEDNGIAVPSDRAKQRRATIQVPPNQNAECAKTDIEYLSGDEYVSERTVPSPTVCPDGFRSTVKSRERTGGLFGGSPDDFHCQIPIIIRKVSPSPEAHNCATDCEEIQGGSDEDDGTGKLDVYGEDSYSRAQTATPLELRRALDESGSSEIHDALVGPPRRMHVDGRDRHATDAQEMPTDVEFLDDDQVEAPPQAE
ncbi:AGAP002274-PB-like protein [Anopheles sinensis]|uniref:AGAP002274-PB-like protein n=1 Tax=Anopheles sinensis TaxID=74873 RepID=A0A084W9D4_ANOSI|nr:AGAP002274-PB-like protein [Anopheles sinensis]